MRPLRALLLSAVAGWIACGCSFLPAGYAVEPPITAAVFCLDGKTVLVGSAQGLAVYSWPELQRLKTIDTGLAHVHHLAFSPDGKTLAAAGGSPGENGVVELLQWPGGKIVSQAAPHSDLIHDVAWLRGGGWITAGFDGLVQVFDAQGALRHKLTGHSRGVMAVALLSDHHTLCSASLDHSIRVWSLETGKLLRTMDQHTGPVVGLALRPMTSEPDRLPELASISEDQTVRLWQPTIGRLMRFARLPSSPLSVGWAADGNVLVVTARDGHVRTIDPQTMQIITDQPVIDGWAYTLAIAPDGRACLVAGAAGQLRRVELRGASAPSQ